MVWKASWPECPLAPGHRFSLTTLTHPVWPPLAPLGSWRSRVGESGSGLRVLNRRLAHLGLALLPAPPEALFSDLHLSYGADVLLERSHSVKVVLGRVSPGMQQLPAFSEE